MDRETIVKFCNNRDNTALVAIEIIAAYCEDMDKKSEHISIFIQALQTMPIIISGYLEIAVDYYKRKFIIFDLYKDDKHLLTY